MGPFFPHPGPPTPRPPNPHYLARPRRITPALPDSDELIAAVAGDFLAFFGACLHDWDAGVGVWEDFFWGGFFSFVLGFFSLFFSLVFDHHIFDEFSTSPSPSSPSSLLDPHLTKQLPPSLALETHSEPLIQIPHVRHDVHAAALAEHVGILCDEGRGDNAGFVFAGFEVRVGEAEEDFGELGLREEVGEEFHGVAAQGGYVLVVRGGGRWWWWGVGVSFGVGGGG